MSQKTFEAVESAATRFRSVWKKCLGVVLMCGVAGVAAQAQYPTPPQQQQQQQNNPVQWISNQQFDQMMQDGELQPTGPLVWLEQYIEQILRDARNQAVVDQFVFRNGGAPAVRQILQAPRSPNSHLTPNGNYQSTITLANGTTQNVELMSQGTKLGQMANTVITASDPTLKLALYTDAYTQYATAYTQLCGQATIVGPGQTDITISSGNTDENQNSCATLTVPSMLVSPTNLLGASLGTINAALRAVAFNGQEILHRLPVTIGAVPPACSAEIGVGDAPSADGIGPFGDETNSVGASPSSTGLYANFDFPAKRHVTCIKNQGTRGTCHIFAAISAIEYLIARDTGAYVNLNEQDFMEKVKSVWSRDYNNDGGDALDDLTKAQTNGYHFGRENYWDYNPSLSRPVNPPNTFTNSCLNYPYPSLELGCSASAPQAPEFCTIRLTLLGTTPVKECAYYPVSLADYTSYSATGGSSIWDYNNTDLSIEYMYLALGFNNAVILAFNETDAFNNSSDGFVSYHPLNVDNVIGGHAVHIIGYVSNEDVAANPNTSFHEAAPGGGYFIAKNSWGAGAGDAGYYYLPVDYVRANATGVYVISAFQQN